MQTKYNEVRVSSLRPAAEAHKLFGNNSRETKSEESINKTPEISPKRKNTDKASSAKDSKDVAMDLKKFKEQLDSRI